MSDNPMDLCTCGHTRAAHIYDEGACRPGYECELSCGKFNLSAVVKPPLSNFCAVHGLRHEPGVKCVECKEMEKLKDSPFTGPDPEVTAFFNKMWQDHKIGDVMMGKIRAIVDSSIDIAIQHPREKESALPGIQPCKCKPEGIEKGHWPVSSPNDDGLHICHRCSGRRDTDSESLSCSLDANDHRCPTCNEAYNKQVDSGSLRADRRPTESALKDDATLPGILPCAHCHKETLRVNNYYCPCRARKDTPHLTGEPYLVSDLQKARLFAEDLVEGVQHVINHRPTRVDPSAGDDFNLGYNQCHTTVRGELKRLLEDPETAKKLRQPIKGTVHLQAKPEYVGPTNIPRKSYLDLSHDEQVLFIMEKAAVATKGMEFIMKPPFYSVPARLFAALVNDSASLSRTNPAREWVHDIAQGHYTTQALQEDKPLPHEGLMYETVGKVGKLLHIEPDPGESLSPLYDKMKAEELAALDKPGPFDNCEGIDICPNCNGRSNTVTCISCTPKSAEFNPEPTQVGSKRVAADLPKGPTVPYDIGDQKFDLPNPTLFPLLISKLTPAQRILMVFLSKLSEHNLSYDIEWLGISRHDANMAFIDIRSALADVREQRNLLLAIYKAVRADLNQGGLVWRAVKEAVDLYEATYVDTDPPTPNQDTPEEGQPKAEQVLSDALEQLRVQQAGCSTAALGVGMKDVALKGDYGWSLAYQDTLDLRRKYDELLRVSRAMCGRAGKLKGGVVKVLVNDFDHLDSLIKFPPDVEAALKEPPEDFSVECVCGDRHKLDPDPTCRAHGRAVKEPPMGTPERGELERKKAFEKEETRTLEDVGWVLAGMDQGQPRYCRTSEYKDSQVCGLAEVKKHISGTLGSRMHASRFFDGPRFQHITTHEGLVEFLAKPWPEKCGP